MPAPARAAIDLAPAPAVCALVEPIAVRVRDRTPGDGVGSIVARIGPEALYQTSTEAFKVYCVGLMARFSQELLSTDGSRTSIPPIFHIPANKFGQQLGAADCIVSIQHSISPYLVSILEFLPCVQ